MLAEKIAHKIDDLQSKSEMINSLQESLYVSIFCQDVFLKTDFEGAFILLGIMTSEIAEELKELTDFAFENLVGNEKIMAAGKGELCERI